MCSDEKIRKYANIVIDNIKQYFEENPDNILFEAITNEFENIDDIHVFIEEWDKKMNCVVYITPLGDGKYRINGDRSISRFRESEGVKIIGDIVFKANENINRNISEKTIRQVIQGIIMGENIDFSAETAIQCKEKATEVMEFLKSHNLISIKGKLENEN